MLRSLFGEANQREVSGHDVPFCFIRYLSLRHDDSSGHSNPWPLQLTSDGPAKPNGIFCPAVRTDVPRNHQAFRWLCSWRRRGVWLARPPMHTPSAAMSPTSVVRRRWLSKRFHLRTAGCGAQHCRRVLVHRRAPKGHVQTELLQFTMLRMPADLAAITDRVDKGAMFPVRDDLSA